MHKFIPASFLAICTTLSCLPALAQDELPVEETPVTETVISPDDENQSPGFYKGLRERDFSLGYARRLGFSRFEDRTKAPFVTIVPRWGRFRSPKQEILYEVPITIFTQPETKVGISANILFRQYLSSRKKVTPFIEAGPGLMITNSKVREISGSLQFVLQSGVGVRVRQNENTDWIVALRWYHLSNAGMNYPNTGINNALLTIGYSRLF